MIATDSERFVWIEDESRNVGKVFIPEKLWLQMRNTPLIRIESSFEERLDRLVRDYATEESARLEESIAKIEKRLGYDNCKFALEACREGNLKRAAEICLIYYDKAYGSQLKNRFGEEWEKLPSYKYNTNNEAKVAADLRIMAESMPINEY
jgi:tRNA 2-selenouridine synthase